MKKTKLIIICLTAVLTLALTACSKKDDNKKAPKTHPQLPYPTFPPQKAKLRLTKAAVRMPFQTHLPLKAKLRLMKAAIRMLFPMRVPVHRYSLNRPKKKAKLPNLQKKQSLFPILKVKRA